MTKAEYIATYGNLTVSEYRKMTKAELLEVMADFWEALENGVQEYCTPTADVWSFKDEVSHWYHKQFDCNPRMRYYFPVKRDDEGNITALGISHRKKDWFVNYVIVLDLAFASMNEIMGKHRYHDCLSNLQNFMRG